MNPACRVLITRPNVSLSGVDQTTWPCASYFRTARNERKTVVYDFWIHTSLILTSLNDVHYSFFTRLASQKFGNF